MEKIEITNVDSILLQKMVFIFNAIEKGWTVKKKDNSYIFTKSHGNNKKEVYLESYLKKFITENLSIDNI